MTKRSLKTLTWILALPAALMLAACSQSEVSLSGKDEDLAERSLTEAHEVVIYPDDNPSIPDGGQVWKKMECASCHGADGHGVAGKTIVDLTDVKAVREEKPLDRYSFLTYGDKATNHPALKDSLSRRQIWDLVFYTRSLATPYISKADFEAIDPVFGANCAVCHGKQGHGDGPLNKPIMGSSVLPLQPNPANFHEFKRFYDRTDDLLWDHIANGIEWEGMPNFLGKQDSTKEVTFDEEYVWKLVQYIRHFHSSNEATLKQASAIQESM